MSAAVTTRLSLSVPARADWRLAYHRRLLATDSVAVLAAVFGAQVIWFGVAANVVSAEPAVPAVNYLAISILITIAWVSLLQIVGSRDHRVIGTDFTEYRRVVTASFGLFGAIAVAAYLLQIDLARGYIVTALPLGLLILLASRLMWRRWLRARRLAGEYCNKIVLVGSAGSVAHLARELGRVPLAGYRVVGACIIGSRPSAPAPELSVPVWRSLDDVLPALDATGADTVAVTNSDELSPEGMRELSWSLEPGRRHLVVAPSLTDIAGPRIHTRPVAGLPLIHVETPRYEGRRLYAKRAFDIVASTLLIVALAPLLLAVAAAVRLTDNGPVFFSQPRVGKHGTEFRMLKFRSMVVDAESRLAALHGRNEGNEVLFKMRDDPRITPIGRVLRRYSIDELPQLFNVWLGDMSLVGPRPPLAAEVAQYEEKVNRRFLVKPGITGLWQVSGRSDLSWEETVRYDLFYVENWSLTGDVVILWRTARAVLAPQGAY